LQGIKAAILYFAMNKNYQQLVTVTGILLGMNACATSPSLPSAQINPETKISEINARMQADQAKHYDLISPGYFEAAGEYISEAQDLLDANESKEAILEDEVIAEARLQTVEENAASHWVEFEPLIHARQAALSARAQEFQSNGFTSAEKELRDIGIALEQNRFHSDASELSDLEIRYSQMKTETHAEL
jgi:hypothetical protein